MIRCHQCFGQKKVMGIGLIESDCPTCKGVGKIDKPLSLQVSSISDIENPPQKLSSDKPFTEKKDKKLLDGSLVQIPKVKRGRPKTSREVHYGE